LVEGPALALYLAELVNDSLELLSPIGPTLIEAALRCDSASVRARAARLALLRGQPFDVSDVKLTKLARADFDLVEALLRGDFVGALRFVDTVNGKDPAKPRTLDPDVRAALTLCWIIASGSDGGAWARLTTRLHCEKQGRDRGGAHDGLDTFVHTIQFGQPPARAAREHADSERSWLDELSVAVLGFWRADIGPENLRPRPRSRRCSGGGSCAAQQQRLRARRAALPADPARRGHGPGRRGLVRRGLPHARRLGAGPRGARRVRGRGHRRPAPVA
jgi:hypothetical protein